MRSQRSSFAQPMVKRLDWDVDLKPVIVENTVLPNYQSIVRNDNSTVLNITKKSYHPAKNEKFMEVVSKIHEFTGFEVEGYNVFQEGRKVLAFLKNPDRMKIGEFHSDSFMVIGNSFDCSTGFFTGLSNVVIRCTNQFSRMKTSQSVRHDSQINLKLDELVRFHKAFLWEEEGVKQVFGRWNAIAVNEKFVEQFVDHVLNVQKEDIPTIKLNQRNSLFDSINAEMSQMGSTGYGLFNGLTHYTTHVVKQSGKMFGNALGHSYRLNERGFKYLSTVLP